MINPNGASGGSGECGMTAALETRTCGTRPMGILAVLASVSPVPREF
jgi:hypothetical protein